MALDKLKNLFGTEEEINEASVEETYYSRSREDYQEDNGPSGSKMMLLEPRAYSESQQIADYLKLRNAVVVNLKRVTPDQAKRIVDFLSGTLYAINGDIQKLGGGIFLCTPNNVNVEGKISDDNAPAQNTQRPNKNQKTDNAENEDEFNW